MLGQLPNQSAMAQVLAMHYTSLFGNQHTIINISTLPKPTVYDFTLDAMKDVHRYKYKHIVGVSLVESGNQ